MKKLLIVDDDEGNRTLTARRLQDEPYEVTLASNGKEALQIVDEMDDEFDIIISDWEMPELDGLALCKEVRIRGVVADFILMTGANTDEVELGGTGPDIILHKPFGKNLLLSSLERLEKGTNGS